MYSKSNDTILKSLNNKFDMYKAISENIANANTTGYKRQIPEYLTFKAVLDDSTKDHSQGKIQKTNKSFDLAIDGNAAFMVETAKGLDYTRNGRLGLDSNGDIVSQEGHKVVIAEKTDKDINLAKETDIKVNEDGEIIINGEFYGRIAMKRFDDNPIKIHQGHIEGSNVNLMTEMVSLQQMYRSIESTEKILGMEISIDKELIEKYGRNV